MKPEFRIREVTRYVITRHDHKGTQALVEADSLASANDILAALEAQADHLSAADDASVDVLGLSTKAYNIVCSSLNVETIGELKKITATQILKLPHVGKKSLIEIEEAIRPYGGLSR